MATATTDAGAVAFYDTVRMRAFGPIFDTTEHAEDFRRWAIDRGYAGPKRLTQLQPGALDGLHTDWMRERLDDDGYLKLIEN